ncbi:hypothetical protein [Paracoccus sp. (in: a-proteobacteria)]|uniref:hypothetical protein n=1 Tax=Paracoccus sp. TaxID=267 RepID=UPI0028AAD7A1|nr:hypothetical protein [Paracoccus sp. (in: a-proteobacteria)]
MRLIIPIALPLVLATLVLAESSGDRFIDDRSSPERVVTSLYNAINRQEYLRAWSYFNAETAPPWDTFRDGYANTAHVELRIGEVQTEGAAGSIHSLVPVALKATDTDQNETVFVGCYRLTQVQPAVQATPPFRPIQIDNGKLEKTNHSFDEAMGQCQTP